MLPGLLFWNYGKNYNVEDINGYTGPGLLLGKVQKNIGGRFLKPARYVVDLGDGEYLLFSEDFELLDAVFNCF